MQVTEINNEMAELVDFINELANQARIVTLSYFRTGVVGEKKSDDTPVTLADRQTEDVLREMIALRYPLYGIIGEEKGEKTALSEFEWIIDPIDGTKNFLSGYPLFGTLICLLKNKVPILSMIDSPAQDERWLGLAEEGTYYNGELCTTSDKQNLADAILCCTDFSMFNSVEAKLFANLQQQVYLTRFNGDCYLYGMLASGWIDLVVEADLKVYDFLPLVPIIEAAGGVISDWQGKPLTKKSNGQVVAAANTALHQQAIESLRK